MLMMWSDINKKLEGVFLDIANVIATLSAKKVYEGISTVLTSLVLFIVAIFLYHVSDFALQVKV